MKVFENFGHDDEQEIDFQFNWMGTPDNNKISVTEGREIEEAVNVTFTSPWTVEYDAYGTVEIIGDTTNGRVKILIYSQMAFDELEGVN